MTVFKQLLLRLWLITVGRFNANLTRSIVQKIAITGKPKTSYRFKRDNFCELKRKSWSRISFLKRYAT